MRKDCWFGRVVGTCLGVERLWFGGNRWCTIIDFRGSLGSEDIRSGFWVARIGSDTVYYISLRISAQIDQQTPFALTSPSRSRSSYLQLPLTHPLT